MDQRIEVRTLVFELMYKTYDFGLQLMQPYVPQIDKLANSLLEDGYVPISMNIYSLHGGRPDRVIFLTEKKFEQSTTAVTRSRTALIVVDVQNDFCEGGSLPVTGGRKAAVDISNWIKTHWYDVIVATKDYHENPAGHWSDKPDFVNTWPEHCKAGSDGALFHQDFDSSLVEKVFLKGQLMASYSGFEGTAKTKLGPLTSLHEYLKAYNVENVDIVGIAGDYCVKATAVDSAEMGYKTRVLMPMAPMVDPSTKDFLINFFKENDIKVCEDLADYDK